MDLIHNQMPVILHPRDHDRWLTDYDESRPPVDLLRPYEADGMRLTSANRLVGNPHRRLSLLRDLRFGHRRRHRLLRLVIALLRF
jgi:putative SOS response-associated peptidase YedK